MTTRLSRLALRLIAGGRIPPAPSPALPNLPLGSAAATARNLGLPFTFHSELLNQRGQCAPLPAEV